MHGLALRSSSWCLAAPGEKQPGFDLPVPLPRELCVKLQALAWADACLWRGQGGLLCAGLVLVGAEERPPGQVQPGESLPRIPILRTARSAPGDSPEARLRRVVSVC